MARLRHEISAVMAGGAELSRDNIREMTFLACVIKESQLTRMPVLLKLHD